MSKLIEELSTLPEWNSLGAALKEHFRTMESEELDNLNEKVMVDILEGFVPDVLELAARLVMEKVREEWRQEGHDEFDKLLERMRNEKVA